MTSTISKEEKIETSDILNGILNTEQTNELDKLRLMVINKFTYVSHIICQTNGYVSDKKIHAFIIVKLRDSWLTINYNLWKWR